MLEFFLSQEGIYNCNLFTKVKKRKREYYLEEKKDRYGHSKSFESKLNQAHILYCLLIYLQIHIGNENNSIDTQYAKYLYLQSFA